MLYKMESFEKLLLPARDFLLCRRFLSFLLHLFFDHSFISNFVESFRFITHYNQWQLYKYHK